MELHTVGIDLGKTVFHLVGLDLRGEVVVRKKFSRTRLLRFTREEELRLAACSCPPGEGSDSGGFILADVEDCVQLRHFQEIQHLPVRTKQL